ncbi:MAG TPA: PAS-domain containing protein [Rhizomicrobium sp.]|nr:PAS-domain containing protein [Rhizomicrobium sp.]
MKLAPVISVPESEAPDLDLLPEALDALRVALTVFDADMRLVYANRHFNYLFRSMPDRETLVGEKYEDLIRREVQGGEIAPAALLPGLATFIARRQAQFRTGEFRPMDIPLSDGRIVEIKARQTKRGGWIALWTDVTHARHDLMRFEDVTELSSDAVAFYDKADKLVMCNDGYARMIGAASPDQLKGLFFADIVRRAVESDQFLIDADIDFVAQRTAMRRVPSAAYTLQTKSGVSYLVRDRATRDGGRAVVFTDVTDNRRTEAALDEQIQSLKRTQAALANLRAESIRQASYLEDLTRQLGAVKAEAGTAKTALLRTMSHELKTPLNAIIGFADLLRTPGANWTPLQVVEYADLIHTGGLNLLRLLNQILDLTRIAGGRYDLRRERLDAKLSMLDVQANFAERAEAKNIAIDVNACAAGVIVDADENALRAMLAQLIDNAINFTQSSGKIELMVNRSGPRVRFVVSDNGPGVEPEDLERILEPFEQVGRGTSDHQGGAGLGLTLAKSLAELHGGSLAVQSVPGQGFTAMLELPGA